MKRQTSEPLTVNHASKPLFQELPDEVLEQISGGDGTCASCTVDYIAVNDEQQGKVSRAQNLLTVQISPQSPSNSHFETLTEENRG